MSSSAGTRHVLIVDDDDNLRYSFRRMFDGRGYQFIEAGDGAEAIERVRQRVPDVVVMDLRMPGMDGLTAFDEIHKLAPQLPVIIMTAYGTTDTAIEATRRGAFDYILKPFDIEEMTTLVGRALERNSSEEEPALLSMPGGGSRKPHELVGSSRAMQQLYKAIGQVADSDVHVLILGESGTGKELVARAIHEHSGRVRRPFLAINCAAIPESLIESELFGHEKGAFTGAEQAKTGLLQACDEGTVFLDEIAEVPLPAQAKLLRFLQEGEVIRLGSDHALSLNVRVIAATNRDLAEEVGAGRFRADLYYRLNTMAIQVPPLADRLDDVEALVAHFVARFNEEHNRSFQQISSAAITRLRNRRWPGNVRELENMTRKAVIVGKGAMLLPEHFFPDGLTDERGVVVGAATVEQLVVQLVDSLIAKHTESLLPTIERMVIELAYERTGCNQVQAAKMLGISRNTLRNRLERYEIL